MKKVFATLVLAVVCGAFVFAGETHAKDGMLIAPGDKALTVGLNFPLGVNGAFELGLGKFDIGELRFTYGAKALGSFMMYAGGTGFSAGGAGTIHFSWSCLDLPEGLWWVKNFDTFIGLGAGFSTFTVGDITVSGVGFMGHGGSSYFFSKNMAISFAGGMGGSYIGLLLKM